LSAAAASRPLDVVVFGAAGFVGRLTAGHLARCAGEKVRIGLAGRSLDRLAAVRAGLGARAADWPLLVADSADPATLTALARSTAVLTSTVGPYARHGLPLVAACAAQGTHYADLTGEPLFVRRSIDLAHQAAVASGARIVHSCGFDSVPSDLAVLAAHERAQADGAGDLTDVTFVLVSARGGFSGGTVDSLRNQVDEVSAQPRLRQQLGDPYAFSPQRGAEPELGPQPDSHGVRYDRDLGVWTAPFVMAAHTRCRTGPTGAACATARWSPAVAARWLRCWPPRSRVARAGSSPVSGSAPPGRCSTGYCPRRAPDLGNGRGLRDISGCRCTPPPPPVRATW